MEKQKVVSAKGFLSSLEKNFLKLKMAMRDGNEEEFNRLKNDSLDLIKKMEELVK